MHRLNSILETIVRSIACISSADIPVPRSRNVAAKAEADQEDLPIVSGVAAQTIREGQMVAVTPIQLDITDSGSQEQQTRTVWAFENGQWRLVPLSNIVGRVKFPNGLPKIKSCINCAYFLAGRPHCCNAFHEIGDPASLNQCVDFEAK
jgi:hypothetical protein